MSEGGGGEGEGWGGDALTTTHIVLIHSGTEANGKSTDASLEHALYARTRETKRHQET